MARTQCLIHRWTTRFISSSAREMRIAEPTLNDRLRLIYMAIMDLQIRTVDVRHCTSIHEQHTYACTCTDCLFDTGENNWSLLLNVIINQEWLLIHCAVFRELHRKAGIYREGYLVLFFLQLETKFIRYIYRSYFSFFRFIVFDRVLHYTWEECIFHCLMTMSEFHEIFGKY